jgi:hypothetical protein
VKKGPKPQEINELAILTIVWAHGGLNGPKWPEKGFPGETFYF